MKDRNQGLGGGSCPKRAPPEPVQCCQAGQDRLLQQVEWRQCCGTPQSWPLFAHLQREQKLLVPLVSPNPSFSLVFLSKARGLASAPRLWRQQLAKLRVSHVQTPLHSAPHSSPLHSAPCPSDGCPGFWGQVPAPPGSEAPGTFPTAGTGCEKRET